ncbi:MAG: CinA family protein [Butyricimonas faecihominis]
MKLRLTAKGDQVFNLDARYDSLKEALEGQRYTEGENGEETERELGELLMLKGKTIATAESCTGGNIAAQLTSIAGSSAYFRGSVVAYANDVKERVLGVRPESLEQFGLSVNPWYGRWQKEPAV